MKFFAKCFSNIIVAIIEIIPIQFRNSAKDIFFCTYRPFILLNIRNYNYRILN